MKNKIILIQGALDIEIQYIVNLLESRRKIEIGGYEFYDGFIDNMQIVVSKTLVGTINATIATCIGITNFKPNIVINQGIAGAHTNYLHMGDIVIGEQCCNINAYKMPFKSKGEGSNPFEWELNKRAKDIKYADKQLIDLIQKNIISNNNEVYKGILGSGDVHNREYDRILWLNKTFNNLCEDMESIGAYSVCERFNVSCVGIRIISNNDLLSEELDMKQAVKLQKIIVNILNKLHNK